jgi:hypothetical protein
MLTVNSTTADSAVKRPAVNTVASQRATRSLYDSIAAADREIARPIITTGTR